MKGLAERKGRGRMEFKQGEGEEGQVSAVVATLQVVDRHGDVTLPGAFGKKDEAQSVLISPWNHASMGSYFGDPGREPVGDGILYEDGDQAIFEGQFFVDLDTGRSAYELAKKLAARKRPQEWSYGYFPEEFTYGDKDGQFVRYLHKVDAFEVSPVIVGAGIDTQTLDVKGFLDGHGYEGVIRLAQQTAERMKAFSEWAQKEGRELSASNRTALTNYADQLEEVAEGIRDLVSRSEEPKADPRLKERMAQVFSFMEMEQRILTGGN